MKLSGVTWPEYLGEPPTLVFHQLGTEEARALKVLQDALRQTWEMSDGPSRIFAALCGLSEEVTYEMHRWIVATGQTGDPTSGGLDSRDLLAAFVPHNGTLLALNPARMSDHALPTF